MIAIYNNMLLHKVFVGYIFILCVGGSLIIQRVRNGHVVLVISDILLIM